MTESKISDFRIPGSGTITILADGTFPRHTTPRGYLEKSEFIICCDGAVDKISDIRREPNLIIGDMDSISQMSRRKYEHLIIHQRGQDENDLEKAIKWCLENRVSRIAILGATGLREDHTLGNISLLCKYAKRVKLRMITDTGIFDPVISQGIFNSFTGQQVSIFSFDPRIRVTSENLKYPLNDKPLPYLFSGALNESLHNQFQISISSGVILIYRKFGE